MPPTNLTITQVTETTATLRWISQNPPVTDHCWNIEVGAQGFLCHSGQSVVNMVVCTFTSGVTVLGPVVTYTVTGLQPGTDYQFSLVETCDGVPGLNSGFCFNALSPPFTTLDNPFTVAETTVAPTCPEVSPGYVPNGSFSIQITDPASCPGTTYDIDITPVPGSSPLNNTPPIPVPNGLTGVTAGSYPFDFAGAGQYEVSVTETGPCNPAIDPVDLVVTVPDGLDSVDPVWQIADVLGNVMVDNDPMTPPLPTIDLGNMVMPDGSCGIQQQLYATGLDLCDGIVSAANAVSASAVTTPASIMPGTQVSVIPDGFGVYLLDVFWSIGTTTLTVQMQDAAGNNPDLVITTTVDDNTTPQLSLDFNNNITIPNCQSSVTLPLQIAVDNLCDQGTNINPANLNLSLNGTEMLAAQGTNAITYNVTVGLGDDGAVWMVQYTDFFGNTGQAQFTLSVEQSAVDAPPVIDIPGNLSYHIPACEVNSFRTIGFLVTDDCSAVDGNQLTLSDPLGAGFNTANPSVTPSGSNAAYVEFSGQLNPGTYTLTVAYPGTMPVDFEVNITNEVPQAPEVILPGNLNFTIPACATAVTTTFAIQILDECDEVIDPGRTSFTLCGNPISPTLPVSSGYFEFVETLDVSHHNCQLVATYEDGDGLITTVTGTLTVTQQTDDWAPIIIYPANELIEELPACTTDPATFIFQIRATDNCDGEIDPVVTANPPAGISLTQVNGPGTVTWQATADPGNYDITITATDDAGNLREENFTITVVQAPVVPADLSCNDTINVTLNDLCQVLIVPDMVLDGEFGCLEDADFDLVVQDDNPANGPILDGCGLFTYEISLQNPGASNFETCWGVIHAEDKTEPELICPVETEVAMVNRPVQFINGMLSNADPTLVLDDYPCFLDAQNPSPGPHFYDTISFTVSEADIYTFELASSWGGGLGAIFQGPVNPNDPCQNMIAQGAVVIDPVLVDFATFDPVFRIALPLTPGNTYVLFTSSDGNNGTGLTGNYNWAIYSDGSGRIEGIPETEEMLVLDLFCTDVEEILVDNLPASVPRCYLTDGAGNVVLPSDPLDQLRLERLLELLAQTGYPYRGMSAMGGLVEDNCGNITICVSDEVVQNGDCGNTVVNRTFTATDDKGNESNCTQQIQIRKPTLDDVITPPYTVFLECDEGFSVDNNGNSDPSVTGFPFVETAFGFQDLNADYCTVGASYVDEPRITTCAAGYKFRRVWNLIDWCDPGTATVYFQTIKVGDYTAPTVTCPFVDYDGDGEQDTLVHSTGPFSCTAAFEIDLPTVVDNCSAWETLTEVVTNYVSEILNNEGQVIGYDTTEVILAIILPDANNRMVNGIPVGQHWIRYSVTDDCDNKTIVDCPLQVVDMIEPVAVCSDDLNISIGGNGIARLYATDLDEGSSDNCDDITLETRRQFSKDPAGCEPVEPYFSPWGAFIDLGCCDVGETVRVEIRVTDAVGNTDICWFDIEVEDKIKPTCIPPHDESISCSLLPNNFEPNNLSQLQELFGTASATDNCPGATWEELQPLVLLDDCGTGTITRRFRAIDQVGNISENTCQQIVTIEPYNDYEILFPADASAFCGDPAPDTIIATESGCDLLAISVEDEDFEASGDECYKTFRTYRVINWCVYDGDADPIVIGREEDCDGMPGDEAVWILRRPEMTYIDRDQNENNANPFSGEKGTSCDGTTNPEGYWRTVESIGFWEYTQHIKVYDTLAPAVTYEGEDPFCSLDSEDCNAEVEFKFLVIENCTSSDLTFEIYYDEDRDGTLDEDLTDAGVLQGDYPKFKIIGEYPLGEHQFEVVVFDGCGNSTVAYLPFEVVDCKVSAPICLNGLALDLMPLEPNQDADGDGDIDTGAAELTAMSFIASPTEECLGPVQYSINLIGQTPDISQESIVLTCDDIGSQVLEVYAWDMAFNPYAVQPDGTVGGPNYDKCETFVLVQDNLMEVCVPGEEGMIAGIIATEEEEPVEGVEVRANGDQPALELTDEDGFYQFEDLDFGYDYTLQPSLNTDHKNGVSTFDLLLISKHILGVAPFTSPYKIIAADINRSGSVSTVDLIQLRRLILNIITEYENNTSWRFVPAAYEFPDPDNPWEEPFPEVININDFNTLTLFGQDFVAIKIGDVNSSAEVNSFGELEERNTGQAFVLQASAEALRPGEMVEVTFSSRQLPDIQGCQFTLNFDVDKLSLETVEFGMAEANNLGMHLLEKGQVTVSWNQPQTVQSETEDALFSLSFESQITGKLEDALHLSSQPTMAEAYDATGQLMDVQLHFAIDSHPSSSLKLMQNVPNPFGAETLIGFELPKPGRVVLQVRSSTGKQIEHTEAYFESGYHQLIFGKGQELAPGVYYYSLLFEGQILTKKMVSLGK